MSMRECSSVLRVFLVAASLAWMGEASAQAPVATPATEPTPSVTPAEAPAAAPAPTPPPVKAEEKKKPAAKISGLIQSRYETHEETANGVDDKGRALGLDRFYVKRGRVKVTVEDGDLGKFYVHVDATDAAISTIDAEATVYLPGLGKKLALSAGQTKVPFGYDIALSSGDREFPERARVVNALFPGVRDQMLKAGANYGPLSASIAVMDGGGLSVANRGADANHAKDVAGRLGFKAGKMFSAGISGYSGRNFIAATAAKPGQTTWYDADGDEVVDPGETTTTAPKAAVPEEEGARNRMGIDLQAAIPIGALGDLEIRAEAIQGKDFDVTSFGWYALVVQNIGPLAIGVRADSFDPDTDGEVTKDSVTTIEPAIQYSLSANTNVGVAYAVIQEEGEAVDNNTFVAQFQVKF